MSDNETSIGGYEWGWTCGECGEHNNLSGMGLGRAGVVNGKQQVRVHTLTDGDEVECGNEDCDGGFTLRLE